MLDYTLRASKQSTQLLHTLFGLQWFGIFWQWFDSKLRYAGSEHRKLVGNPNGRHDITAAPCSRTSILRVSSVTFLPIALKAQHRPRTWVQWNIYSNDILSIQKYYQLFTHESNTFLGEQYVIPLILTNWTECTQMTSCFLRSSPRCVRSTSCTQATGRPASKTRDVTQATVRQSTRGTSQCLRKQSAVCTDTDRQTHKSENSISLADITTINDKYKSETTGLTDIILNTPMVKPCKHYKYLNIIN